jgi:hypothetical protein
MIEEKYISRIEAAKQFGCDKQDIGCQVERLWNLKISPDKPYVGRRCTITQEPVNRKKQKKH